MKKTWRVFKMSACNQEEKQFFETLNDFKLLGTFTHAMQWTYVI